jgi:hypothetical protein
MAALIGVSVKPTAGADYTCKVPLDLLSEDGVPPAQGDKVSYSVDGTVDAVTGDEATITLDAINGQPVGSDSGQEEAGEAPPGAPPGATPALSGPGETTANMGARLRKGAKANTLGLF